MSLVIGRGRYARAVYPMRRTASAPPPTPSAVTRIWTPAELTIEWQNTNAEEWENVGGGFIALTGHSGGAILGNSATTTQGIVFNADNWNTRIVLARTGAADLTLSMQGGSEYAQNFLGSSSFWFWAPAPDPGVTYDSIQLQMKVGGNGGNRAPIWNGQLTVQEVTFS